MLTKMLHGLPHISSTNSVREGFVLGKHHSDICGPIEVPSISHAVYFVTFIDDFRRKSWVYFLKNKSEVFSIFQIFKSLNLWLKMSLVRRLRL